MNHFKTTAHRYDPITDIYPLIHLCEDGDLITLSELMDIEMDALSDDCPNYPFLQFIVSQFERLADDDLDYLCWLPQEVLILLGLESQ